MASALNQNRLENKQRIIRSGQLENKPINTLSKKKRGR